ncbi:MAG: bicyclomycin resistance protein [Burkholderiales bacterium]|nr:bicyclomycin resistance protein [Burkholderiales bacterium]
MLRRRDLLAGAAGLPAAPAWAPAWAAGPRTLRLALAATETPFDPPQTDSSLYTAQVIGSIFESPLGYDYLARPARLRPVTAAAMPEVSADFRQFTLRIRPGILFDDDPAFGGRPRELTAADYVYSFKRFYDPRWKSADLPLFENAQLLGLPALRERCLAERRPFDYDTEVDGLHAPDRYTLRIRLAEPDPRFAYLLAQPAVTGAVAREVVERYGDDIGAHPVGTGAYRLATWRRGSRVVLERAPRFRGEVYAGVPADTPLARQIADELRGQRLPLIDRIEFNIIEEQQPRWLAFVNRELDLLEVPGSFGKLAVPNGQLAPYLRKQGVRLQLSPMPDMSMSYFNCTDPLVGGNTPDKVALRRAIALAHDGAAWIRLVRGGLAVPAQSPVPPFTHGHDPAYRSEMSEHDPARARALLDLYGYHDRDGDGWRETPAGQPLVLRIASLSDTAARDGNEVWQRSLAAVGLRARFEPAGWSELLRRSRAGALMIWGYALTAATPDGGSYLGLAYGPNAGDANDARFALPAFDRLYERQRRLPDGPERDALMREAKNLMVAYMPYKVHGHRIQADLMQPALRHHWRHPFMRDIWRYLDIQATRR